MTVYGAIVLSKAAWSVHQAEKYTLFNSTPRKHFGLFAFFLEDMQAIVPCPPSFRCAYSMGNW